MKKLLILGIFSISFLLFGKADAQMVVKIRPAKPAKVLSQKAVKRPGHKDVWIDGHGNWNKEKKKYVWRQGHWIKPKPGHRWAKGRWIETKEGHKWVPGRWKKR